MGKGIEMRCEEDIRKDAASAEINFGLTVQTTVEQKEQTSASDQSTASDGLVRNITIPSVALWVSVSNSFSG